MAGSTLTVRTLALATVALVLACGHAVKAMGDQRAAADRSVNRIAPSVAPIRVVPAGSGHSTIATFSNNGKGATSGNSRVATFTSKGGSAAGSIVTFGGDRVDRRALASKPSRGPQPAARTRPKGGILPPKGDPPVIAVRRGTPAPRPASQAPELESLMGPPEPVQLAAVVKPKQTALRNAFGGLASSRASVEPSGTAPLVYAHAAAK